MSSFIAELKRRNVFKIGIAYAIVAWLIAQIIAVIHTPLHLPDWFDTVVLVSLGIGFPIVLIITWAFELTPEGIKPTPPTAPAESITLETGKRLNYTIIGLMALVIVFLVVNNYVLVNKDSEETGVRNKEKVVVEKELQTPATASAPENKGKAQVKAQPTADVPAFKSIAVLPFTDLSQKKDQGYFADGLTEELLNKLAQVQDLEVTARTSSFYFKGKNEDVRTIGKLLGVAHLLEGSVRKDGNRLRITAQLIKTADGNHLWSKTYDRELTDIFAIQDDIAQAVTTALSVTLGAGAFNRPGMTRNVEVFDLFLKGLANFYKATPDSLTIAIDQLNECVRRDPDFALGWGLLSYSYRLSISSLPPAQTFGYEKKFSSTLERAQALAPNDPAVMGLIAEDLMSRGRWREAERIYQQHLDTQNGAYAGVNQRYGNLLQRVGRLQEALPYLQRARRLNPLDVTTTWNISLALYNMNRLDEAVTMARHGLTLDGFQEYFRLIEWLSALEKGDGVKAAEIIANEYALDGENPSQPMLRVAHLLRSGDNEGLRTELQTLLGDSSMSPYVRMNLVNIAAWMGQSQLAIDNFPISSYELTQALWGPHFSGMRQLPQFKTIVQKLGLVDYWRATGKWADDCHPVSDDDFECK